MNISAFRAAHLSVFGVAPVLIEREKAILIDDIVWTEHPGYYQVWIESHKEQIRIYDGPSQLFAIEAILKVQFERRLQQGLQIAGYDLQFEQE